MSVVPSGGWHGARMMVGELLGWVASGGTDECDAAEAVLLSIVREAGRKAGPRLRRRLRAAEFAAGLVDQALSVKGVGNAEARAARVLLTALAPERAVAVAALEAKRVLRRRGRLDRLWLPCLVMVYVEGESDNG